jgi:iron complex transport system ATP-binding protein
MLKKGEIVAIGTPDQAITPENLRQVFDVEALTIITPVGLQICLLSPSHILVRSRDPTTSGADL